MHTGNPGAARQGRPGGSDEEQQDQDWSLSKHWAQTRSGDWRWSQPHHSGLYHLLSKRPVFKNWLFITPGYLKGIMIRLVFLLWLLVFCYTFCPNVLLTGWFILKKNYHQSFSMSTAVNKKKTYNVMSSN